MNSAWGSVCDSAGVFTSDEAKVVCRQLGILQVEGKTVIYYWILFFKLMTYLLFRIILSLCDRSLCWSVFIIANIIIIWCLFPYAIMIM